MDDAEADRVLDRDDEEIVEAAAVPEPVLGLGDQVDVAVDGHGNAEPWPARSWPNVRSRSREERAVAADARGALDDPRDADAEAADVLDVAMSASSRQRPHAVLDEVEDHRGRLPVDPDRDRDAVEDVGLEIGDGDGDLVGRELHAADRGRLGIELEHDPRPAAQLVGRRRAHGAERSARPRGARR